MAILFTCQSPTCEHCDTLVELLGDPATADCECGAPMEPVELDVAATELYLDTGMRSGLQ